MGSEYNCPSFAGVLKHVPRRPAAVRADAVRQYKATKQKKLESANAKLLEEWDAQPTKVYAQNSGTHSMPDVGSSRNSTFETVFPPTSAMHSESLRFIPPLSAEDLVFFFSVNPTA
eukprot:COSAG02_NODE_502_length_21039_cov_62.499045_16_plen_116_part_00